MTPEQIIKSPIYVPEAGPESAEIHKVNMLNYNQFVIDAKTSGFTVERQFNFESTQSGAGFDGMVKRIQSGGKLDVVTAYHPYRKVNEIYTRPKAFLTEKSEVAPINSQI